MNQRNDETLYYVCDGAQERFCHDSAEGQVQNLKYEAAFPFFCNISDQPTHFIALKDGAGLVKKYAMVNVQRRWPLEIRWKSVKKIMKNCWKQTGGGENTKERQEEAYKVTGKIEKIARLSAEFYTFST